MTAMDDEKELAARGVEPSHRPEWEVEPRWSLDDRRALERAARPGLASTRPKDDAARKTAG